MKVKQFRLDEGCEGKLMMGEGIFENLLELLHVVLFSWG